MEQGKRKLPMWLTALLVLIGALAGVALIILTVVSIAAVEGFATLIFLILNVLIFIVWPLRHKTKANLNGALGTDVHSHVENGVVEFAKENGGSFEGHLLFTLSINYKFGDLWKRG